MRGATPVLPDVQCVQIFQSTHPMRGATRAKSSVISEFEQFQSTHPMRGATRRNSYIPDEDRISIHAPHAGCDCTDAEQLARMYEFQSTHPMRGATVGAPISAPTETFQSTHPMRGATPSRLCFCNADGISIHAPHAGCDGHPHTRQRRCGHFNPRTPCGVRPRGIG